MTPFELIYKIGSQLRNPSLYSKLDFLLQSQYWSQERLIEYQLGQLNKLLKFARKYSVFYRSYFAKHGFNTNLKSLDKIKQLPPITKEDLLKENLDIHTNYNFKKTFFCETSGSTGQVLTFRKNEEWDSENRAAMIRSYSWHDVNPWEYNIYFWGYNIDSVKQKKIRILDFIQNRYRIFDYNTETLESLFDKLGSVSYIHGYSSMIYELAKLFKEQETKTFPSKLKMIKGTSEMIYPYYNEEIKNIFGRKMISEYGAAESGIIAFECTSGNMHINMESVIVEEENNEIIVTNLLSYSFPIIRYKLGDYIKLLPTERRCECGLEHPIIDEVHGRVGKNIYGHSQKYPSLTLYYVFKNLYFDKGVKLNYQCIQSEKSKLIVLIKEEYSEYVERLIINELKKYFKNDLDAKIEFSQTFRTFKSKLIDFISEVDQ